MWKSLRRLLGFSAPSAHPDAPPTELVPMGLLIDSLGHANPERRRSAEVILRQKPAEAVPALAQAARTHSNDKVARGAIALLAELGEADALHDVVTVFDVNPQQRAACYQAMAALLRKHGQPCEDRLNALLEETGAERVYLRKQVRTLLEHHAADSSRPGGGAV